jgi:hypothetical protein
MDIIRLQEPRQVYFPDELKKMAGSLAFLEQDGG